MTMLAPSQAAQNRRGSVPDRSATERREWPEGPSLSETMLELRMTLTLIVVAVLGILFAVSLAGQEFSPINILKF
jgi:hypothetical protein